MRSFVIAAAILLAVCLLCLCRAPAEAGCTVRQAVVSPSYGRQVVTRKSVTHHDHHDVAFIKYIAFAPIVEFPTYSAVYTPPTVAVAPAVAPPPAPPAAPPPAAPPPAGPTGADWKALLDVVKRIDERLTRLEGDVPGPKPKPSNPFDPGAAPAKAPQSAKGSKTALSVVNAKCVMCHDAKVSAEKGGGFDLVKAGQLVKLSAEDSRKLVKAVLKGTMPKKPILALNDEEGTLLIEYSTK